MFDKESGLVKVWLYMISKGLYTLDDVPELFNLREIVAELQRDISK